MLALAGRPIGILIIVVFRVAEGLDQFAKASRTWFGSVRHRVFNVAQFDDLRATSIQSSFPPLSPLASKWSTRPAMKRPRRRPVPGRPTGLGPEFLISRYGH